MTGSPLCMQDLVMRNPPYQESDGGSAGGAMPVYQKFVQQAKTIGSDHLCLIIPARWFAGGRGLNDFRTEMLNDDSIKTIVDYPKSRDCFPGVDIAGGVCYFIRDKNYHGDCKFISISNGIESVRDRKLNEHDVLIRDNIGLDIVRKVRSISDRTYSEYVAPVSPFGLRSFVRGKATPFKNSVTLISSKGKSYIDRSEVKKGIDLIDKYKVCVGYLNPDRAGVNNASDKKSSVTTKINIYEPGTVITETYIIVGAFDKAEEARKCAKYIQTKFVRFLVLLTLSSMHITKANFQFVPWIDMKDSISDEELYRKYSLTLDEINHIETLIRDIEIIGEAVC